MPIEKKQNYRLVLASRSPRRKDLLTESGYQFTVLPGPDEEDAIRPCETPETYTERLACRKAELSAKMILSGGISDPNNVLAKYPDQEIIILGCDSIAVCQKEILGKPVNRNDARRMLHLLSGSVHYVHSGICLAAIDDKRVQIGRKFSAVETSELKMDPLSEEMIENYLDSGQWTGKAGAFGYQDGNDWLHLIQGSASNVVGLPLELLERILPSFLKKETQQ